jgi:hypothetical protein
MYTNADIVYNIFVVFSQACGILGTAYLILKVVFYWVEDSPPLVFDQKEEDLPPKEEISEDDGMDESTVIIRTTEQK